MQIGVQELTAFMRVVDNAKTLLAVAEEAKDVVTARLYLAPIEIDGVGIIMRLGGDKKDNIAICVATDFAGDGTFKMVKTPLDKLRELEKAQHPYADTAKQVKVLGDSLKALVVLLLKDVK
jgi:hypothetical protein